MIGQFSQMEPPSTEKPKKKVLTDKELERKKFLEASNNQNKKYRGN